MRKRPPTSAQLRDRQKAKDLTRIADSLNDVATSLDDILELLQNTVELFTHAAEAVYRNFTTKEPPNPPTKTQ